MDCVTRGKLLIRLLLQKELNLVWVGVASFLGVFFTLFGAMVSELTLV